MNNQPDYSYLFETVKPDQFLGHIFLTSKFSKQLASHWKREYLQVIQNLKRVYEYYDEYDLYKFFEINHILNKDLSKEYYKRQLFKLVSDLWNDIPEESSFELDSLIAKPDYVYHSGVSELVNIARDFLYYGYNSHELRSRHGIHHKDFIKTMKEIYQQELLPIDISQQSFY